MFTQRYEYYCRSGNNDPESFPNYLWPHDKERNVVVMDMKRVWIFFVVCRLDTKEPDHFLLDVSLKTFSSGMEGGGRFESGGKSTSSSGKKRRSSSYEDAGEEIKEMRVDSQNRWEEVKEFLTNGRSTTQIAGKCPTPLADEMVNEDWYEMIEKRTLRLKRVKDAGAGDRIIQMCQTALDEAIDKFENQKRDTRIRKEA